ncbi:MAG TPA: hypothetical protein VFA54_05945 [Bryobacterales bacterium]|jgi:flagellar biosynthesis protein FlhF|nr:hypothetical protein [Bryobacterales bacterium]
MNIRAYHSDSVESAIRQAKLELGGDAILLESKETPIEERHRGLYEVRFGFGGTAAPPRPSASRPAGKLFELSQGIEEIRRMLYSYTRTYYLPAPDFFSHPALARLYQNLAANEISPELAMRLMASAAAAAKGGASDEEVEQALAEHIGSVVPSTQEIGMPGTRPRVIALVGPAGSGKTTTMAKLAVRFQLERRQNVQLLSADTYRVGAIDQLRTYAAIVGAGWTAAEECEQLAAALDRLRGPAADGGEHPGLIVIDTPGFGFSGLEKIADLAAWLRGAPDVDIHLVVSASLKPRDLRRTTEKYRIFGPRKLLFTKLDETLSFGPLLEEAIRTGWALSFLSAGQGIPEDLTPATPSVLADLALNRRAGLGGC